MKNKSKLFILPLLFACCSCAYGKYDMVGGSIKSSKTSISASYKKFDGYFGRKFNKKYQFTIAWTHLENNEGSLTIEAKNTGIIGASSQSIQITSEDSDGSTYFPLNNVSFDREYEIKIIGDNHSGSFSLTWSEYKE